MPTKNNTILFETEPRDDMTDAERALFVITLMSFVLAGKQCHCNHNKAAIVGPSLGRACYLHTYIFGFNIIKTIYLSLVSKARMSELKFFEEDFGLPAWEEMPKSPECSTAQRAKKTYLGQLVPLSRFVFLKDSGVYMIEGIQYPNHKEGWQELSMAIKRDDSDIKVLQASAEKRPWRELTSLLSYIFGQDKFDCLQLEIGLDHAKKVGDDKIKIWSGGLQVTGDPSGQKVSGADDFVESGIVLDLKKLSEDTWFDFLKDEMKDLDDVASILKKCVYKANLIKIKESKKRDGRADSMSNNAEMLFWQLCERRFQDLVDACDDEAGKERRDLRLVFAGRRIVPIFQSIWLTRRMFDEQQHDY